MNKLNSVCGIKLISKLNRTFLLFFLFLSLPVISYADENNLKMVKGKIANLFPDINKEDVLESSIDGWYIIQKGALVAYISHDGRYLFQGDVFDIDNQINVSEENRNAARRAILSTYSEESMIVFTPEKKHHSVSIFTDIDCTFCRRLHNQIEDYMSQGIEIRYLLYPRTGPDTLSWTKAQEVWCSDNRNSALTLAKLDQKFDTYDCDSSIIQTHYKMGQDVGLRGTPAIVLEDGSLISGYLSASDLSKILSTEIR